MASNAFGQLFKVTTFGESHGKAVGVVIDGCPAGIELHENEIAIELIKRAPGKSPYTSPRKEPDHPEIISGVFEGRTTGAPICILISNKDADPSKYEAVKHLLRPGHANYTYIQKYGVFDYRGGGRSSARETACRVAAGAVAKKLLAQYRINVCAYIKQIGTISAKIPLVDSLQLHTLTDESPIFCPDIHATELIMQLIAQVISEGDSLGGIVEFLVEGVPVGLGDPIYEKLDANLAKALMSLPAIKGFEIGAGFQVVDQLGSTYNDLYISDRENIRTATNNAGGILGGISNGMPIIGRAAFKPTSSIKKVQDTLTIEGEKASFQLPEGSRHDPCVAIRAVPVVEAMVALVIADALLMNRCAKL